MARYSVHLVIEADGETISSEDLNELEFDRALDKVVDDIKFKVWENGGIPAGKLATYSECNDDVNAGVPNATYWYLD